MCIFECTYSTEPGPNSPRDGPLDFLIDRNDVAHLPLSALLHPGTLRELRQTDRTKPVAPRSSAYKQENNAGFRHTCAWTQGSVFTSQPPGIQSYETDDLRAAVHYQYCRPNRRQTQTRTRWTWRHSEASLIARLHRDSKIACESAE